MKNIIIIVVIIVLIGGGYYAYTRQSDDGSTLSIITPGGLKLNEQSPDDAARAARILAQLNQLKSIKLRFDLFENPVYQTLVDHEVNVAPRNVGRQNPFAPIQGELVQTTQTGGSQGQGSTNR